MIYFDPLDHSSNDGMGLLPDYLNDGDFNCHNTMHDDDHNDNHDDDHDDDHHQDDNVDHKHKHKHKQTLRNIVRPKFLSVSWALTFTILCGSRKLYEQIIN